MRADKGLLFNTGQFYMGCLDLFHCRHFVAWQHGTFFLTLARSRRTCICTSQLPPKYDASFHTGHTQSFHLNKCAIQHPPSPPISQRLSPYLLHCQQHLPQQQSLAVATVVAQAPIAGPHLLLQLLPFALLLGRSRGRVEALQNLLKVVQAEGRPHSCRGIARQRLTLCFSSAGQAESQGCKR